MLGTATAVLAVGLLSACSSGGSSTTTKASDAASKPLDGVSVTVGSKNFTENILVGKMLVQALEADGAKVTDQTNLGGTSVNRKALLSGDIDVYPDYDGTGWTVHLGQQDPSKDPKTLFDAVAKKDLADNQIKWVGLSPFNDTYGFAANGDLAKKSGPFDLQSMADYLKANTDAKLCLETEFPDRPDGLILFEKATGYTVPQSQIQILDTGLIYNETAKGSCQFGEVYTTDGRISALGLSLVKDPGVFILYNASYTWRDSVFEKHADVYTSIADKIFKSLDAEKMASLNAQVDVDGKKAGDVAKAYLKEIGVL
jgi:osmoprotectant transport system substrate-binding protein